MSPCCRPFFVSAVLLLLFASSHFLLGVAHSRTNPSAGNLFRLHNKFKKPPRAAAGSSSSYSSELGSFAHLARLRAHDARRHARFLASADVFELGGIADPNVAGLYFTEVELGTPPLKYYVQVDTGSDLLWVNCKSCLGCPSSSELGVHLALYDPGSSSTSSNILCGDEFCSVSSEGCQSGEACGYKLGYGDGSTSQGYFIRDVMKLDIAARSNSSQTANSTVVFGCGTTQSGGLGQSDQALDGIMGFGQSNLSIISQLANQEQVPKVFAHCLEGEGDGGGILVIGDVQAKGLVYTALIPDQPHYNVNLTTISVNGISIPVDSDSSASGSGGTIIDSGTTLSYFSERVYQELLTAVLAGLRTSDFFTWEGMTCTSSVGSINDVFPSVTFTFNGDGATIVVKPSEYLVEIGDSPGNGWCVGFQTPQTNTVNLNIIGDLILKDRLFIYDLEQQRIGWVEYDCSSNVTVLSSNGQQLPVSATSIPSSSIDSSSAAILYVWIVQLLCLLSSLLFYNS